MRASFSVWLALGAVVSSAAAAPRLVPPLERARGLADLDNPVRRHDVITRGGAAELATLQAAFLAGNWHAFEAWAGLAARLGFPGAAAAPAAAATTPHGKAWTAILAAPAAERDGFIRFLVVGRRLHAGLLDRLGRPGGLPPCDDACKRLLLAYLGAFAQPRQAADQKQLLGVRIVEHSHFPDELTVGLAGDLGLADARPHLERFVKAERRFHQLFTDYSTSPEEVGSLFDEALRALVKLGGKPTFVNAEITRLTGTRDRTIEWLWMETTSDSMRGGSSHEVTRVGLGPDVPPDNPQSKRPLLRVAARALGGDAAARALLSGRIAVHPAARWVTRVDVSSALEGRGGRVLVTGKRLLTMWHQGASAIDLTSGDRVWEVGADDGSGGAGIRAWLESFDLGPRGLWTATRVATTGTRLLDEMRLIAFDPDSGALSASLPLPATTVRNLRGAIALPDGVWLTGLDGAIKVDYAGKLLETRQLDPGHQQLRAVPGRLAIVSADRVHVEGKPAIDKPVADLLPKVRPVPVIDDILIDGPGVVVLASYQRLYGLNAAGALKWSFELPEQWAATPTWCGGERLCARSMDKLYVLAGGKLVATLALPWRTRHHLVVGDTAYLLAGKELTAQSLDGKRTRTVVGGLSGSAALVGVTDDCVLVSSYHDVDAVHSHLLSCFPP